MCSRTGVLTPDSPRLADEAAPGIALESAAWIATVKELEAPRERGAMPLLYYWRPDNYARDRRFGFGYHLNQNSPRMADASPGDSLWAFTRRRGDGLYVLAAELVVRALTRNPPNYHYGTYRI